MQATSMSAALVGCSTGAAYANNAPEQSGAGLYVQVVPWIAATAA